MSPALNGSSVIQRFEGKDVIEICNGITFDFYMGCHTYIYMVYAYSIHAFCPICAQSNISTLDTGSCKPLLAQETRLERLNSGNQCNRDLKTVRKARHY